MDGKERNGGPRDVPQQAQLCCKLTGKKWFPERKKFLGVKSSRTNKGGKRFVSMMLWKAVQKLYRYRGREGGMGGK